MDFRDIFDGLRAGTGGTVTLPTPDLQRYYAGLAGAPLALFDIAAHALLHTTTPCTRSLHLDLGGDAGSLAVLAADNLNRLLLGLAAGDGALRGHAPLLGLPAPRLLGEGTSLAEALAFLPLPVRSFTLRAGTLAEALGMLAGFRDRCFAETTGLVLLRDPALERLDGLLPGQIQGIKPALAAAGAAGLVLWLRDLATEPFGAVLARVADAPRRRHATVWNALPFARRFDGSTGITAAEPPQEAAES